MRNTTKEHNVVQVLPSVMLGGAGFSYQLHETPESLPATTMLSRAFDLNIRAIDTSPYYEPSEQLLGAALNHPDISERYRRSDYVISTKVGRKTAEQFDYSPQWIKTSVVRSLQRFRTDYLDIVFCHDVEFVSIEDALAGVGVLLDFQQQGVIHHVGISGYDLERMIALTHLTRQTYGKPVNVVQSWAQLTLQNSRLEQYGFARFRHEGVSMIYNSSPLAAGLLRDEGPPVGGLGDWHPAPSGLRESVKEAATYVASKGDKLANVSLRYSLQRANSMSCKETRVGTIIGAGTLKDLEENAAIVRDVKQNAEQAHPMRGCQETHDELVHGVRNILGHWLNFDFQKGTGSSPSSSQVRL